MRFVRRRGIRFYGAVRTAGTIGENIPVVPSENRAKESAGSVCTRLSTISDRLTRSRVAGWPPRRRTDQSRRRRRSRSVQRSDRAVREGALRGK